MPPVESSSIKILPIWDRGLVEHLVVGVLQGNIFQPLIFLVEAISNDLHLWLVRNRLEIGVEDGSFGIEGLAVTVAV